MGFEDEMGFPRMGGVWRDCSFRNHLDHVTMIDEVSLSSEASLRCFKMFFQTQIFIFITIFFNKFLVSMLSCFRLSSQTFLYTIADLSLPSGLNCRLSIAQKPMQSLFPSSMNTQSIPQFLLHNSVRQRSYKIPSPEAHILHDPASCVLLIASDNPMIYW